MVLAGRFRHPGQGHGQADRGDDPFVGAHGGADGAQSGRAGAYRLNPAR